MHWLRAPGDRVAEGEPLLEVATDKVDTEIVARIDGKTAAAMHARLLLQIVADVDEVISVGQVLARIDFSRDSPASSRRTRP